MILTCRRQTLARRCAVQAVVNVVVLQLRTDSDFGFLSQSRYKLQLLMTDIQRAAGAIIRLAKLIAMHGIVEEIRKIGK